MTAGTGYVAALVPVPAISFDGPVEVTTVLQRIAANWPKDDGSGATGITDIQNNGVNAMLDSPYFTGSPRTQAVKAVGHARAMWNACDDNTLKIWPAGGYRDKAEAITISKDTGLVGFPSFTANGLLLRTLYNKDIRFGSRISVESILFGAGFEQNSNAANFPREWGVNSLTLDL